MLSQQYQLDLIELNYIAILIMIEFDTIYLKIEVYVSI